MSQTASETSGTNAQFDTEQDHFQVDETQHEVHLFYCHKTSLLLNVLELFQTQSVHLLESNQLHCLCTPLSTVQSTSSDIYNKQEHFETALPNTQQVNLDQEEMIEHDEDCEWVEPKVKREFDIVGEVQSDRPVKRHRLDTTNDQVGVTADRVILGIKLEVETSPSEAIPDGQVQSSNAPVPNEQLNTSIAMDNDGCDDGVDGVNQCDQVEDSIGDQNGGDQQNRMVLLSKYLTD